jgi:tetratricopeptide (TPR) repeat protein
VLALMLHNRGFVALSDGRSGVARADLERAVELLPGLAEAHRNLGVLHGEAGRFDEAMRCFGRALAAHPGDADALLNLAVARAGADDLRGALDDLEIFALLAPGHPRLEPLRSEWSRRLAIEAGVPALDEPPGVMQPGLQVTWFRGTDLRREVTTRIARDLDLDAGRNAPLRGLPSDGSSARWTGWFKAPEDGAYQVFAVSNDGLRFELGDTTVLEHWRDVGYTSWQGAGEVHLLAGWHPLRIEWFDDSGNARLWIKIALDGREYPFDLREHLFHVVE